MEGSFRFPAPAAHLVPRHDDLRSIAVQGPGDVVGLDVTQSRRALDFGLGDAVKAEEVTVTWPDRSLQKLKDLPAGRLLKIRQ